MHLKCLSCCIKYSLSFSLSLYLCWIFSPKLSYAIRVDKVDLEFRRVFKITLCLFSLIVFFLHNFSSVSSALVFRCTCFVIAIVCHNIVSLCMCGSEGTWNGLHGGWQQRNSSHAYSANSGVCYKNRNNNEFIFISCTTIFGVCGSLYAWDDGEPKKERRKQAQKLGFFRALSIKIKRNDDLCNEHKIYVAEIIFNRQPEQVWTRERDMEYTAENNEMRCECVHQD